MSPVGQLLTLACAGVATLLNAVTSPIVVAMGIFEG
jgi:hypothetical protein